MGVPRGHSCGTPPISCPFHNRLLGLPSLSALKAFPCCATTSVTLHFHGEQRGSGLFYPSLVAPRISFALLYATLSDRNVLMTPPVSIICHAIPIPPRICLSRHPPAVLDLIVRPAAWIDFNFRQRQTRLLPSVRLPPKITQPLVPGSTVTIPPRSIFNTWPKSSG